MYSFVEMCGFKLLKSWISGNSKNTANPPLLNMFSTAIVGVLVASQFQKSPSYTIHHNAMVDFPTAKWEIDAQTLHEFVAWPSIAKERNKWANFPLQEERFRHSNWWYCDETPQTTTK